MALIYLITNSVNGKRYVGQTRSTLERRFRAHVHDSRTRPKFVGAFVHAIRKHGPEAFKPETLCYYPDDVPQIVLDEAEAQYIAQYDTLVPNGYNLKSGGCRSVMHETTKAKIGAANVGKARTAEARERYRQARLNETPENRRKRLAFLTGRKADPAHIAKMNAARLSSDWLTPDVRYRMGSSARGKPQHPNQVAALRAAHVGAKRTPEQCARIRAGILAALERKRQAASKGACQ